MERNPFSAQNQTLRSYSTTSWYKHSVKDLQMHGENLTKKTELNKNWFVLFSRHLGIHSSWEFRLLV